jgi:membrane protein YdbS with pleckstrin-like domain
VRRLTGTAAVCSDIVPTSSPSVPRPTADALEHRLDPRVVPLERITGGIASAVVGVISFIGVFSGSIAAVLDGDLSWTGMLLLLAGWAGANAALAWHLYRWPAVAYEHASYRVDPQGIEIRTGVVWRQVTNVPRSRVQHTDVSQGPLERRFGLGTLVVYTAGTDHAKVALSGLAHETALGIRELLLPGGGSDAV